MMDWIVNSTKWFVIVTGSALALFAALVLLLIIVRTVSVGWHSGKRIVDRKYLNKEKD